MFNVSGLSAGPSYANVLKQHPGGRHRAQGGIMKETVAPTGDHHIQGRNRSELLSRIQELGRSRKRPALG